jgi:thiosulfate dehydrogenase [quinone] large subunit
MSISASASDRKRIAVTGATESGAATTPITLSERSMTGLALIRIFVGYLWFQQLFWKMPPDFKGLYPYITRESLHTIIPGYGYLLQHTFLAGCTSLSAPAGCTAFVPLAACVWTAELLVTISLLFGFFTRFGAMLATILSLQLYVGLAYAPGEWIWTYGMLVLLALVMVAIPAGRRLGADQWLAPRLQAAGQHHRLARIASRLV